MVFLATLITGFLSVAILASAFTVKDPSEIEEYTIYVAIHEGVNVNLALAIARAESDFQPNAHNPVGTASGVFQFLNSTFQHQCIDTFHLTDTMADKNNPVLQVNCAIEMLKEPKGYMHWFASIKSWGHTLNEKDT